jgi:hypothetical protein
MHKASRPLGRLRREDRRTAVGMLLLVSTLWVTGTQAQLRDEFVDPTLTDPAIQPLTDLPGASIRRLDHFVAIDSSRRNGFLYLHLVGSGGLPENNLEIARHAAELGFHVVSLAYPNWPSVQELTNQSGDGAAPGAVREERLFGVDASTLVDIDAANSVTHRLVRLLEFLDQRHPAEGWDRFLVGALPKWRRILIGGHSQGAGHAAYLGKEFELAGIVVFGGPGDFVAGIGVADWLRRPATTPPDRMFGFVHELDPNYTGFQITQATLGLAAFGSVQDVDLVAPSDWTSHRMSSSRLDVPNANFHGAVVVDEYLPREPGGRPAYAPVWDYLLGDVLFTDSFGD